jgi:DNA polymerase-3 subunit gamma/tau
MMAAEMAVIRLTHVADLPAPEDLLRRLQDSPPPPAPAPNGNNGGGGGASGGTTAQGAGARAVARHAARMQSGGGAGNTATARALAPEDALARFARFDQVVELIRANRDVKLLVEVETTLRLARYAPGRIEFEPTEDAPRDLAARLSQRLQDWTGVRWAVSVVGEGGGKTVAEVRDADRLALEQRAREHPLVQAVFDRFPAARITEIRTPEALAAEAEAQALPEVEEEWDPFEED